MKPPLPFTPGLVVAGAAATANWNLNQAREIAWSTALALWEARDNPAASDLLRASLGSAVAATSQLLLVAL